MKARDSELFKIFNVFRIFKIKSVLTCEDLKFINGFRHTIDS